MKYMHAQLFDWGTNFAICRVTDGVSMFYSCHAESREVGIVHPHHPAGLFIVIIIKKKGLRPFKGEVATATDVWYC